MKGGRPFRTTRDVVNLRQGRNEWYRITNATTTTPARVDIFDEIGWFGITAADFVRDLSGVSGDLDVHINSPGGDVFDGIAIYNALLNHKGTVSVHVDGLAASAASFIAMAAAPGQLVIAKTASMMIHEAFGLAIGNAADMRQMADMLDQQSGNIAGIYADRSGKPVSEWRDAMRAETWYVGQEAVDAGLADEVQGTPAAGNTWDLSVFARRPGEPPAQAQDAHEPAAGDSGISIDPAALADLQEA
jgi:ATP-dependent Clp endopeptidase proteolytic subunit ClpP